MTDPSPQDSADLNQSYFRLWFSDWTGKLTLFYGALVLFHALYVLFQWGGENYIAPVSNIIAVAIYTGPSLFAWLVSRRAELPPRRRLAWRFIALANISFMLGEAVWLILETGYGLQPFPSAADVGYLAFYPLMLCGLLCSVERFRSFEENLNFWL